jgi:hypothetical protein
MIPRRPVVVVTGVLVRAMPTGRGLVAVLNQIPARLWRRHFGTGPQNITIVTSDVVVRSCRGR